MVSVDSAMATVGSQTPPAQVDAPPVQPPPLVAPAIDLVGLPNNHLPPLNTRLDRTNYSYWRALVLAAARAYNVDSHILGTAPPPSMFLAGNVPNPAYAPWSRLDQFLVHWLFNSVTDVMLGHVVNCRTAAEIWNVFASLFVTRSKARVLQVRGLLQSTKKGSSTVDEYILQMKQYADILAQAGEPISDESLGLYILGGLGPEFEATVITMINRSETMTLQEFQFSLHSHEMRIQQQLSTASLDSIQAHLANVSLRGSGRSSGRGSRGGPPSRGGRSQNNGCNPGRSRLVCQVCGKHGHSSIKCHHRYASAYTVDPPPPSAPAPNAHENPQAFITESNNNNADSSSNSWYLDTAATNHMATDPSLLSQKADYKGKAKVLVGNGFCLLKFSLR